MDTAPTVEALQFDGNAELYTLKDKAYETRGSDDDVIGGIEWAGKINDTIFSYFGNDRIMGSAGSDIIDGGDGTDRMDYSINPAAIDVGDVWECGQESRWRE